jgi:hypothetical protein
LPPFDDVLIDLVKGTPTPTLINLKGDHLVGNRKLQGSTAMTVLAAVLAFFLLGDRCWFAQSIARGRTMRVVAVLINLRLEGFDGLSQHLDLDLQLRDLRMLLHNQTVARCYVIGKIQRRWV